MEQIDNCLIKIRRFIRDFIEPAYPDAYRDVWMKCIFPYLGIRDFVKMRRVSRGWKSCIEMVIMQEQRNGSDYPHKMFNFGHWALSQAGIPNLDRGDFSLNNLVDLHLALHMPRDTKYVAANGMSADIG